MRRRNTPSAVLSVLCLLLGCILGLRFAPAPEPEAVTRTVTETVTQTDIRYIQVPAAEPVAEVSTRYSAMEVTEQDIETMARLVYLEARGESFAGQRMVAEVVLNRVLHEAFPDTIQAVIFQSGQFSPAGLISSTEPEEEQYKAVRAALAETPITDSDVVFFSRAGFNNKVFATVGNHVFCRY